MLESERSKTFAVCISLQTKAIKVSLGSPELENIPQAPRNRDQAGQNDDARKAVSATFSVLILGGAIFRPRSWRRIVQIFFSKPRPSPVSLESPGLENIPQVPGKRAEVDQNHDSRNAGRLLLQS